jgi:hypothetical protein
MKMTLAKMEITVCTMNALISHYFHARTYEQLVGRVSHKA